METDKTLFENDLENPLTSEKALLLKAEIEVESLKKELIKVKRGDRPPFLNRVVQGAMTDIYNYSEWVKNNILELERIQNKRRYIIMETDKQIYLDLTEPQNPVPKAPVEQNLTGLEGLEMDFGQTPFTDF